MYAEKIDALKAKMAANKELAGKNGQQLSRIAAKADKMLADSKAFHDSTKRQGR